MNLTFPPTLPKQSSKHEPGISPNSTEVTFGWSKKMRIANISFITKHFFDQRRKNQSHQLLDHEIHQWHWFLLQLTSIYS